MFNKRDRTRARVARTVGSVLTAAALVGGFVSISSGVAAAAASAPGVTAKTINIGYLSDVTSFGATSTGLSVMGFKARIAAQNAAGGVNGRKIIYKIGDTQSTPASFTHGGAVARHPGPGVRYRFVLVCHIRSRALPDQGWRSLHWRGGLRRRDVDEGTDQHDLDGRKPEHQLQPCELGHPRRLQEGWHYKGCLPDVQQPGGRREGQSCPQLRGQETRDYLDVGAHYLGCDSEHHQPRLEHSELGCHRPLRRRPPELHLQRSLGPQASRIQPEEGHLGLRAGSAASGRSQRTGRSPGRLFLLGDQHDQPWLCTTPSGAQEVWRITPAFPT